MKTALTIAGSDPSGGAGIQADLKTMTLNGVYAMSVITALTVQNTLGVIRVEPVTPALFRQQLAAVLEDIPPDAVKIGMLPSREIGEELVRLLRQYGPAPVVVDPVMIATGGGRLMGEGMEAFLKRELLPLAALATPNIPEAEALTGRSIRSEEEMAAAAESLCRECGCAVLLKGGHSAGGADDVLALQGRTLWFRGGRIANPNSHGTGCTLSSAAAANLAKGFDLEESVRRAKDYVTGALEAMLDLGAGRGPMNHAFDLRGRFTEEKKEENTIRKETFGPGAGEGQEAE